MECNLKKQPSSLSPSNCSIIAEALPALARDHTTSSEYFTISVELLHAINFEGNYSQALPRNFSVTISASLPFLKATASPLATPNFTSILTTRLHSSLIFMLENSVKDPSTNPLDYPVPQNSNPSMPPVFRESSHASLNSFDFVHFAVLGD